MKDIQNRTFPEIRSGDAASLIRTLTPRDVEVLMLLFDGAGPARRDAECRSDGIFPECVMREAWIGWVVSAVLAIELPGSGAVRIDRSLHLLAPIVPGDTLTATVTARERIEATRQIAFDLRLANQRGEEVMTGTVLVTAPTESRPASRPAFPEAAPAETGQRHPSLVDRCAGLAPIRTAVVHPVDPASLLGAIAAARAGLIVPVLVGPERKIRAAAAQAGIDLSPCEIMATEHSHAAAMQAVALARAGKVEAVMKGALHTDEFMQAAMGRDNGLRTDRRMSHVFAIDLPGYSRPIFVTDAAINIRPTLAEKRDIVQNAIDLAHVLGIARPRVAILSAVETVTGNIPSTLDAAALCKMADRGQITGAIVDGPLAFDNAVSADAARTKGIVSPVAGRADIFVVPDIEAGNILAKQLEYLADAHIAGIVLGARVPIILTSRSDGTQARLDSCAIAVLLARRPRGTES